jgi:uncharacterized glyoxalase superfamily protein PhnB
MAGTAKPMPDGYHTVTASFTFKDSQKALDFYAKAFAAADAQVFSNPSGRGIMHATVRIGDTILMMGDEMPGAQGCQSAETLGGSPVSFYVYVRDADAAFNRAVAAGASVVMPVAEMFWGDRCGTVRDPFGLQWMIATHTQDLTPEQVQKGAEAFFASMAKK